MKRRAALSLIFGFICAAMGSRVCRGDDTAAVKPEPWSHSALTVTAGLDLWLDAGRQDLARKAYAKPALKSGQRVETWFDASGRRRHVAQKEARWQPTLYDSDGIRALQFDGEHTHFSFSARERYQDFTIFVVAAPFANPGDFRAFLAMNQNGRNDYVSGLTIDMGGSGSTRFATLNPEGNGFGGAVNLMHDSFDFGTVHFLSVVSSVGPGGTKLYVDGKLNGQRDRARATIHMDNLTVGARFYNNFGPAHVNGFLPGAIMEILVYNRAVSDAERKDVEGYLKARYGEGKSIPIPGRSPGGKPLIQVAKIVPVQMFVPGFTVREVPVDLTNINNVRYRADGKLVALAYSGNIYVLSDSKGTGLEDKVELFWENKGELRAPIGMALTPPGYKLGNGVFVACKGKLSLLVDSDGDGKADKEIILANGWKELPHGVDALGVALDQEGNIYFGLGTTDYANPYVLDGHGKAHYDPKSERGTILKVSADFKKRETVATGVRFSVGLAFNRQGDLFATDQEGATWLPNGNPLDELLHIQRGRHYGFPPRHPLHLPGVIDEPSTFDYGPQHQSTCGLTFNGPAVFGPRWWEGDALIAGYSRGKLYRTKLVKTPAGYVARNDILACLNTLAVDACVSPTGELVVAAHGGFPDWGNGPTGKGKLYKISYTGQSQPQPVMAWAAGPQEVRVAFDRPLDLRLLRDLSRRVTIEYGEYVRAGDRFESLRPGYDIVHRQLAMPRVELPLLSAQVSADQRTLILTTAPHPEAVHYALTLPGMGQPELSDSRNGALPQYPAIDLDYDLCGVAATWQTAAGETGWSGWLPHLDLAVSRALTAPSAEHERLWQMLPRAGKVTLRTKLDLWQMLRPALQPGSTLDYTLAPEEVTLTVISPGLIEVKTTGPAQQAAFDRDGRRSVRVKLIPKEGEPLPLEISLDSIAPTLEISYATAEDPRPRALQLRRHLLPWAASKKQTAILAQRTIPELEGGNWARGRSVFFSEQSQCSKCHQVRGLGGKIGPDLSNLVHRDYESVLRDIREPSAAINPDYVTYAVALRDGRLLQGVVRNDAGKLVLADSTGKETTLAQADVETLAPSPISTMPIGLDKALGGEKLRDLLTFLLTEPLKAAPIERDGAPPPRRRAEVDAVLNGSLPVAGKPRKLHIVLAAGPKDHGAGEHDYPLWQRRWADLLMASEGVNVSTVMGWPTAAHFEKADVIVFYSNNPGWTADRARELDSFLARGGGLVYIHWAVDGHDAPEALAQRIGLAWGSKASRFRHGRLELDFTRSKHPIARGFGKVTLIDESYWNLSGDPRRIDVLASGDEDGAARPLLWTREQGKGRVFVSIPGHYTWTFDDPLFRVLLLRGIAWSAGESVDRFNELATLGARTSD